MKIAFVNPQGNFDNNDSHWTEHADFGGQLVYVKEVALNLAKLSIDVDIITRKIVDPKWPEFAKEIEAYHGSDRVRVIRIPFGGDKFLNKEELWPYLETEFVDGIINFYKSEGTKPDALTGHYGDGGLTCAVLSKTWKVPFTFTAHSLGAQKKDKLNITDENRQEIENRFHFNNRIQAERTAMECSAVNIVSTSQERFSQYGHEAYSGAVDVNDDSRFKVIPPGANTDIFDYVEKENDKSNSEYIEKMLKRDLNEDRLKLPGVILASRLDQKKNHVGAVLAYAKSPQLQEKANLVITLRGVEDAFKDYSFLKHEEIIIMDSMMDIINKYDLKGKVSFFSVNGQANLGATYREFSKRRSVFCLTAQYEPFGLAPIEAMYAGLPAVVTKNGGPLEITDQGKYGIVVDPDDPADISRGIIKALDNFDQFKELGIRRVKEKYTWLSTAKGYLDCIKKSMI